MPGHGKPRLFGPWTAMTPSSTSVSSEQCCKMRTAMTSSSRSRRSFDSPTRPWPWTCLELAKVDTGTCPLRARPRELAPVLKLLEFTNRNFATASSSPSSRSLTTRAKMPSWQLMRMLSRRRSRSKRWTNRGDPESQEPPPAALSGVLSDYKMRTCRRQGGQSYASTEILGTQPRRSWCASCRTRTPQALCCQLLESIIALCVNYINDQLVSFRLTLCGSKSQDNDISNQC